MGVFDWATNAVYGAGARPWNGQANKTAPSAGVIAEGFDPENPLYADIVNWLFNKVGVAFNGIVGATTSLAGVVVDGTGGNTVTPVVGTAKVSTNLISTSTPNPSFVAGTLYKDLVPVAGGYITNSGAPAIGCGFGISSVSLTATGIVQINLLNTLASTSKCVLVATIASLGTAFWVVGNTTTTSVTVETMDTTFTAANKPFSFVLYGTV